MENRQPSTIVPRVVAALISRGVDAAHEYPGYVHIQTERGQHYATGVANDTWTLDRCDESGNTRYSLDTEIPTTENDADVIARAIVAALAEDSEAA